MRYEEEIKKVSCKNYYNFVSYKAARAINTKYHGVGPRAGALMHYKGAQLRYNSYIKFRDKTDNKTGQSEVEVYKNIILEVDCDDSPQENVFQLTD